MAAKHDLMLKNADILIVDKSSDNLQLISDILTREGFQVRSMEKPQLALESALAQPPDLILLDVKIPGINSFELCQQLKEDERTSDIPIIFVSGRKVTKDKIRGFEVGGADYISSPYQEAEILTRVKTHLQLRKMQLNLENLVSIRMAELAGEDAKQRESEADFRSLVDQSLVGVYQTTLDGQVVFYNDVIARMFDIDSPEQIIAAGTKPFWMDPERREQYLDTLRQHGSVQSFEARCITSTGKNLDVIFSATLEGDNIYGMAMDITENRKADKMLERKEAHLKRAQEIAHAGSWELDLSSDELIWSDEVYRIFGLSSDTKLDFEAFMDCVLPEDREFVDQSWQAAMEGEPYDIEHRIRAGEVVKWVREKADIELDQMGQAVRGIGIVQDITLQKEAERAFKDSHERLVKTEQLAGLGFIDRDLKTDEVTWSSEIYNLFGVDQNTPISLKQTIELIHPEDRDYVEENLNRAIQGVQEYNIDHRIIRPDGKVIWVDSRANLELDEDGEPAKLLGTILEITAYKSVEDELLSTINKYRLLAENPLLGIVIVGNSPMSILFANQGMANIIGYSIQELTSLPPLGIEVLIHPDDSAQFFGNFRDRLEGRAVPSNYHIRGLKKDGTIIWLSVYAAVVSFNGHNTVQAMFVDITEVKLAELALQESEDKYRNLIEQALDGIAVVQDGLTKFVNPSIETMIGYPSEEILNREFASFIAPDELAKVSEIYMKRMNNEPVPAVYETVLLHKDGTLLDVELNSGVTVYKKRPALQVIIRDITVRKKVKDALKLSESNLVKAQEVAHIGSWNLDLIHNILTWSDENYRIFGVPLGTPMNYQKFLEIVHPEDREYVDQKWTAGIAGEPYDIDHRLLIDNEEKWVREKAELAYDDMGNPISGIGSTQDITQWKQVDKLVQGYQNRLRALTNELTVVEERERARIANELHDQVSQVLAFTRIQLASARKLTSDSELIATLDEVSKILQQTIRDTRDLVFDLSSPLLHEVGLIAALSEWMDTRFGKINHLKGELVQDDQWIILDPIVQSMLFRSVRELLTNVIKHAQANNVTVHFTRDDHIQKIIVKDDGIGFKYKLTPEELVRGSGFGLFSIQERMMNLGGSLLITSEPGKGCEVVLTIPINKD